ncbi:hypothetical protein GSbR_42240 [Geobacter sp. SVR]|nr:hypothetical protein GSVR_29920 [Geobacter sp. SVR]GCF87624.1 hypothetical protein GSbR_42240 [Geobacter sp. SVR]
MKSAPVGQFSMQRLQRSHGFRFIITASLRRPRGSSVKMRCLQAATQRPQPEQRSAAI